MKQNRVKLLLARVIFALAPVGFTQSMTAGQDIVAADTGTAVVGKSEQQTDAQVLRNKIINKTLERLKAEASKVNGSQENKRRSAIAGLICARLTQCASVDELTMPGCCLYQGDDYLAQVVAIAEKQERVVRAINYINTAGNINQNVRDYFERVLQKLKAGVNVPLPDYFHATEDGFSGIISSKTIKQSIDGRVGAGTYMSSNNEGDLGYGPYAFAIDSGTLIDTKARFFQPFSRDRGNNVFDSLWTAVLKDIPVAGNSIAFIDTRNNDIAHVKELLAKQSLDIEVVDRKTSEEILRVFDLSTEKRELPSFEWKYAYEDYSKPVDMKQCLAENMGVRSTEGVFAKYTFGDELVMAIPETERESAVQNAGDVALEQAEPASPAQIIATETPIVVADAQIIAPADQIIAPADQVIAPADQTIVAEQNGQSQNGEEHVQNTQLIADNKQIKKRRLGFYAAGAVAALVAAQCVRLQMHKTASVGAAA